MDLRSLHHIAGAGQGQIRRSRALLAKASERVHKPFARRRGLAPVIELFDFTAKTAADVEAALEKNEMIAARIVCVHKHAHMHLKAG